MKSIQKIFLALILLFPVLLHAQNKEGNLIGTVIDSSKKTLSYATVSIYKLNQFTEPVKSSYTNSKGGFQMTADTGKYILAVSHVGFPELRVPVSIKPGDNILDTILLRSGSNVMQNITITVRKPLIEQGDDKLTYNVESDPAAKTESATDLLRKTPLVTVDGDGNVQLNGQTNFKVLLNGRETSMFAQNTKDALRNFPGAVISKIEVITSPSAKYDAEGVGGIINIITKKKVIGYNGYLNSYFSTLSNYNESITLNIKSGRLGISTYYSTNGSLHRIRGRNSSETIPFNTTAFSSRTLNGERLGKSYGNFGNLEMTYDLDSFKSVAVYGDLGKFKSLNDLNQSIITAHTASPSELSYFSQNIVSNNPNGGIGAEFSKRYRSNEDKELSFEFEGDFNRSNQSNNSFQDNPLQDRFVSNHSFSKNKEYTFKVDFEQPLKEKQKLELGAKAIVRKASSDFASLLKYASNEDYKPNPLNSDRFHYHQEVYSVYTSYSFPIKKFSFRTGLRAEHTEVNGNFITSGTAVNQSYTNLIPNFLLTRKFTKTYTFTLTYNLRLQRPNINSLNPFVNNNDSLNISFGNPSLGPQTFHAVSIQNRFIKGKTFVSANINSSYTRSMIVQFQEFNSATGVTSTTSANAGKEYQLALAVSLNTPIGQKLMVGANTQLRYNKIENKLNLLQHNKGFSGLASGFFNYKIVKTFTISGSGGMNRGTYSLLSSPVTNYFYQVNFGYKFFKEKLSVTMNLNNFHARYFNYRSVTHNPSFTAINQNINRYRVIYFGATYNFGKLKESVSKKKGVGNDDVAQ